MKLSNLPPGVTEDMIPGNRPEDQAWDKFFDSILELDITPYEAQEIWELGIKQRDSK